MSIAHLRRGLVPALALALSALYAAPAVAATKSHKTKQSHITVKQKTHKSVQQQQTPAPRVNDIPPDKNPAGSGY